MTGSVASTNANQAGVRAVVRALEILTAFSEAHPALQLSDLAEATLLPKPSVHRIAGTLLAHGFLRQGPDGAYALGARVIELGNLAVASSSVLRIATPVATAIARATGETVLIAELDWPARTVRIVHRIDSEHALAVLSPVGRQSPISNGCVAKAGLAGLAPDMARRIVGQLSLSSRTPRSVTDADALLDQVERARALGYATERDEFSVGVVGVAVPLVTAERPIGAIAVVAPGVRCRTKRMNEIGRTLRRMVDHRMATDTDHPDDVGTVPPVPPL